MIKIIDGDITYEISGYKEERIREALRVTVFPKTQAPEPPECRLPDGYRYLFNHELIQERDLGFNSRTKTWDVVSNEHIGLFACNNFFIRKNIIRAPPKGYTLISFSEPPAIGDLYYNHLRGGWVPMSDLGSRSQDEFYARKI